MLLMRKKLLRRLPRFDASATGRCLSVSVEAAESSTEKATELLLSSAMILSCLLLTVNQVMVEETERFLDIIVREKTEMRMSAKDPSWCCRNCMEDTGTGVPYGCL